MLIKPYSTAHSFHAENRLRGQGYARLERLIHIRAAVADARRARVGEEEERPRYLQWALAPGVARRCVGDCAGLRVLFPPLPRPSLTSLTESPRLWAATVLLGWSQQPVLYLLYRVPCLFHCLL